MWARPESAVLLCRPHVGCLAATLRNPPRVQEARREACDAARLEFMYASEASAPTNLLSGFSSAAGLAERPEKSAPMVKWLDLPRPSVLWWVDPVSYV